MTKLLLILEFSLIILVLHLPDTHGQFKGRVTDAETGYPLEFASLHSEAVKVSVLSGPDGYFSIPGTDKDSLSFNISHLGYRTESFNLYNDLFNNIRLLPDYNQIGEVIVTATHFNSSLQSGAGSISLITQDLIDHNLSPTLTGIINQVPGVFMADGTLSTNRLIIRGIGSRNPYGTSKIRIYLDEIPFTLVDGTSSPENINPDIVERIEILKGPSSAIYGAGLGGTIIIRPKFPVQEGFNAGYKTSFGSWSTYSNGADISMKKNNTSFTVAGKSLKTDGYRENSDLKRKDLFLGFDHQMDKVKVRFLFNYLDFRGAIPSSINEDDYMENPKKAAESWMGVKGFEDTRNLIGGISLDYSLAKNLNTRTILFSGYGDLYESRPFNIFDSKHYSIGLRQSLNFNATWMELKVGYEAINEYTEWEIFQTNSGVRGNRLNAMKDRRSYLSGFIHSKITIIPRLRVEPGLSLTFVKYRLNDMFENGEDLSGNYNYKPELSPRLGINYQTAKSRFVYASVGHGFSPPGLEETLLPEGEANTALKPETGWTMDAGFRGSELKGRLYYDIGFYHLLLNDLLLTKRITDDKFMGVNAGKTKHSGAELYLRYQAFSPEMTSRNAMLISSSFTLSQNNFIDFVDESIDFSGKNLPGIPVFIMVHSLDFMRKEKFNVVINFRFYGKQWMNDSNSELYKGHSLVDMQLAYNNLKISDKVSTALFFKLSNLLNHKHASMILVNAPSFGSTSPRYYYPGNPVNFEGGIKFRITTPK